MILDKIINSTKLRIQQQKQMISLKQMQARVIKNNKSFIFEQALIKEDLTFICEVKKASPSKGVIAKDFPYTQIAIEYEKAGASAISVLTEPEFFLGSNEYLKEIKKKVKIPILQKDFIIDEYQIYQASAIGADAILLICSILPNEKLLKFLNLAHELGLSCLVETHNEQEVIKALKANARIIGVNNRNLNTFKVDVNNSIKLRNLIPKDKIFVSESGISSNDDIQKLRAVKANAVLIGEQLMKSKDIKKAMNLLKGV